MWVTVKKCSYLQAKEWTIYYFQISYSICQVYAHPWFAAYAQFILKSSVFFYSIYYSNPAHSLINDTKWFLLHYRGSMWVLLICAFINPLAHMAGLWMWNWTRQRLFSCHFFVGSKTFDRHTDLGRLNQLWHLPEVIENNTKLHFWNSRHNMCQQKLDSVWSFLCDEGKNPMCSTIKACSPIQLYSWSTSVLITWNPAYIPGLYDGFVMFWLRHHSQLFVPRG